MRREIIPWEGGKALIYVPDAPPKGQQHPILCFLHGAGENALDDAGNDRGIDIVANNGSPALHAAADMPFVRDFLVICPQLLRRGHWTDLHAAQVGALVDKVADERGGDRGRCHLTGFSYGGRGVFVFARAKPGRWSSLWAVTPAVQQEATPPPARDKRVFLHFGEPDEVVPAQAVRDFVAKWPPAAGGVGRVERALLSGIPPSRASHGHTPILAYMDPEPYAWLRAVPGQHVLSLDYRNAGALYEPRPASRRHHGRRRSASSLEWADDGRARIISFRRGDWEAELLALTPEETDTVRSAR